MLTQIINDLFCSLTNNICKAVLQEQLGITGVEELFAESLFKVYFKFT
jgi:hypothetical protein